MFKILNNKKGFTLVELLVVVIILAILAAVVIPQLRSSSQDAKSAALDADLSTTRSAIELYYHQHNTYPGVIKQHNGVAHTSAEDAFTRQLTYYSKSDGNTSDTYDSNNYKFGPYIKKSVPKNPLPNSNTTEAQSTGVKVDSATATIGTAVADDAASKGWFFVQQTGEFFANNSTYASR